MVYVDGEYIGDTPFSKHVLEAGNYSVKLSKAGYEDINVPFRVVAGQDIERKFTLTAVVASEPAPSPEPPPVVSNPVPPLPALSVSDGRQPVSRNADWTPVERDFNGTTMVLVPVGSFMMGSGNGGSDEKPVHTQRFGNPFWIDKTEVTRSAYESCVSVGVCTSTPDNGRSTTANQPINRVTWYQAAAYCKWRGVRLPTESEWEYAARGPDNLVFPWGNEFDGNNIHYFQNAGNETAPVGNYPSGASWVGGLDMAGNVREWTSSLYKDYPYVSDDERNLTANEQDVSGSVAVRGGSFIEATVFLRVADRNGIPAGVGGVDDGFRCARS